MRDLPADVPDARAVVAAFAAWGVDLPEARAASLVRAMRRLAPASGVAEASIDARDAWFDRLFEAALRDAR
ncbi:hypothetical protein BSFA1_51490 [Burkholderia sp. SFA1]|uniref:hypothetical protein n=1 Tax=Caballeronia sp. CLC5 TaxID=2906764 RepID=UPI001F363EE8|nr:hypothetical protein [Caballeronia sp. CLC5]MCE4574637.1 hypothetical protein [Caballeronia sp. CLC5]BBQ00021.1 hypothetical protein BSFA1_51490 [Burkholderia sp. SFA1]